MSNSNGMYNVLNIFKKLQPTQEQQVKAEAEMIRESVEAKGSILEGVSKTEQKLQEKYMGFKKTVAAVKKGGSAEDPEAVAASIGRKKYGKVAFQKAAAAGKKMDESMDTSDVADYVRNCIERIYSEASNGEDMTDYIADELNDVFDEVEQSNDANLKSAYEMMQDAVDASPERQASVAAAALKKLGSVDEGYIHKGTYGTEYDGNDEKKAKHVPKKGQRGRPKKEEPAKVDAPKGDIFGRTTGKIPKGQKGKVVKGRDMQDTVDEGTDEKVYRHKGTYGTEYDGDNEKKVKHVPKKGQRGRPKKEEPAGYDWSQFGVTGKKVKLPPHKGNVTRHTLDDTANESIETVYEKAPPGEKAERMVKHIKKGYASDGKLTPKEKSIAYATAWKAHNKGKVEESRQINEGVNFTEMLKKHSMTLEEMMKELSDDIMEFKRSGHVSDTLKDCMSVYEYGKQSLTDSTQSQHALDLNPDLRKQAQTQPKPGVLGKVGQIAKKGLDVLTGPDDEGLMRDLAKKTFGEEEELNELARLAGLSIAQEDADVEEGNEFSGELAKAKAAGAKEFEVDGKKYPVKEDKQIDECGVMSPMGSAAQQMDQDQGRINISTNVSSDGHKNVSINADGDAADQLMAMLKMAGLNGSVEKRIAIAVPTGSAEEVAEADAEYANVPKEEYEGIDAIVNQGDDMNRQKKQFADKPKAGDNPMATENFDPISELGRNLMKEYQSLKISK